MVLLVLTWSIGYLDLGYFNLVVALTIAITKMILIALFSRTRFPLGLPGGLVAVLLGTLCGWALPAQLTGVALSGQNIAAAWSERGIFLPAF